MMYRIKEKARMKRRHISDAVYHPKMSLSCKSTLDKNDEFIQNKEMRRKERTIGSQGGRTVFSLPSKILTSSFGAKALGTTT